MCIRFLILYEIHQIDINTNDNLEQQAQAIFNDMFAEDISSNGSAFVPFSSIAKFKYGTMPKKDKISDTGYPLFSGYKVVGQYSEKMFTNHQLIIVARGVGGTGDIKYTPKNCYLTNLAIAILIENPIYERYLYQYLLLQDMKVLNTGSAQPQITVSSLEKYMLYIPKEDKAGQYSTITTPMLEKIRCITKETQKLAQLRDTLLPRLMSGEIDVSQVEI